jgi:glycosyltransferase involved in cell wall biosynthesis
MPEISIIVCTYNRDKYIKKTLDCLKDQSANPDSFEVIIIDNNSTDQTASICTSFLQENQSLNFHYFLEKDQGHTYARNRGIKEAKGDLLAFIDDDAFVQSDYVKNSIYSFNTHKEAVAIGGKINPVYESGQEPKWMSKFLLPLVAAIDMGSNVKQFGRYKFPIGANMIFRKEVFDKYGLFDVNLGRRGNDGLEGGDEKDVFDRLKKDDLTILYDPAIMVDHIIPDKRLQISYIKGLGIGVGTSERKRIRELGNSYLFKKWWSEVIKSAGTVVLFFFYMMKLRPAAAFMLIRFRYWVIKGLLK